METGDSLSGLLSSTGARLVNLLEGIMTHFPIEAYIGRCTTLRPAGRNLRGTCPFCKEDMLFVFHDRGNWRCFGKCSQGGDLIAWVQKHDAISVRDAISKLSDELDAFHHGEEADADFE